jgi:GWxTD domain-containing protein
MRVVILFLLWASPLMAGTLKLNEEEKNWLASVRLIMTRDEDKAFKKLPTHEQRQTFMEWFWARRDPDLSEPGNPFKDEYFARIDYVVAHFKEFPTAAPKTDRGYVYMLLGPPTRVEPRADYMIVGFNYRNPYPHFPPELWVYESLPFKTGKRTARVQMIAVNSFGDYTAITDSQVEHLLRTIKYDFIIHPDLEAAPATPGLAIDLQENNQEPSATTLPELASQDEAEPLPTLVPLAAPAGAERPAMDEVRWAPDAGDSVGLLLARAFLDLGAGKLQTVLRYGVAESQQASGPRVVRFALFSEDRIVHLVDQRLPGTATEEQRSPAWSFDWAASLEPGEYVAKLQLEDSAGAISYRDWTFELPAIAEGIPAMSPLSLLDPHVPQAGARINLKGRAFAPLLKKQVKKGDFLYPAVELFRLPVEQDPSKLAIILSQGGREISRWAPYPEEISAIGPGHFVILPSLRTRGLDTGTYDLRMELELIGGTILLREDTFELTN